MATTGTSAIGTPPKNFSTTPDKYTTVGTLLDPTKLDVSDYLVKTYGDQGITGFLTLTGAVKNGGAADFVQWYEEGRRHKTIALTGASFNEGTDLTVIVTLANIDKEVQAQDVVMNSSTGEVFICTGVTTTATQTATFVMLVGNTGATDSAAWGTSHKLTVLGNMYGEGTGQPSNFFDTTLDKRTNNYMIVKEIFKVTGSQATNIGYVNVGNGDYRWYIHGENEARKRFMDKREMMMLLGQRNTNASPSTGYGSGTISGSEGYFSAIEDRGLVTNGYIDSLVDLDIIITALDRNGAGPEYAVYVDRLQDLAFDDFVAKGVATASLTAGVATQFGAFNNNPNMAIELGFKSFGRGGYTFHKHDWKLLKDPTLLGVPATATGTSNTGNGFAGVMIPMATVVDPKTGNREFPLEINYKSTNGVSREMQHWLTGSFMGATNSTLDVLQFNYLSEIALVTRAANRHVLIKRS